MLNPLHMLRDLRDDDQLTTTEFTVLAVAVLRTNNATGRVRASQEDLAEDAKLNRKTVNRVLHSEAVAKYLTIEVVSKRQVNLTWRSSSGTLSGTESPTEWDSESHHLPLSTIYSQLPIEVEDSSSIDRPEVSNFGSKDEWIEAMDAWDMANVMRKIEELKKVDQV